LAEKASLLSGADKWRTKAIPRVGLAAVTVSDGPHGLRKEIVDPEKGFFTVHSTCFPTASATACSFDRRLLRRIGAALAEECRAEGVDVLLGPGLNCKRSPLCGRNFEYFSEDPVVSGELAAAYIEGVQSMGVGTSMKHFALNNQEYRRLTIDAVVDERAMFELYLSSFERVLAHVQPWTVMCSYNRVKGVNASDNKWLLTDVLRSKFGFAGLVMSDWGAVHDRVLGVSAGLDLEMPYVGSYHDAQIEQAVSSGALSEEEVDRCAARVVALAELAKNRKTVPFDTAVHHALAREAAAQSAVLLKNEDALLPLAAGKTVAVFGAFAQTPRYQGAGSSKVQPLTIENPLEELRKRGIAVEYAEGYREAADALDEVLMREACDLARQKDAVLIYAGLPDRYESEGFDRESLAMPKNQVELILRVAAINSNVAVVLSCGSVVELDWADRVQSILLMHLGGEAVGGAVADLVSGAVSPSGKLAESWPLRLADTPSHKYFPGYTRTVEYRESVFVGYRYFDTAQKTVRYPFGHGLSYTAFTYSNLQLSAKHINAGEALNVSLDVANTGGVAAAEVVQLYVAHRSSVMFAPEQELKGFEKTELAPGETKTVTFTLARRDLCYYDVVAADWRVEGGAYEIRIAASSRDIRLSAQIQAAPDADAHVPDHRAAAPCYYDLSGGIDVPDSAFSAVLGRELPARERQKGEKHTLNVTLSEVKHSLLGGLLGFIGRKIAAKATQTNEVDDGIVDHVLYTTPLRMMSMESDISPQKVEGIVHLLNHEPIKGIRALLCKEK
ncbi:MAG: glycoside hydrolase family 3 C-terminal domain-containing protein, partial [Eubacteriales bacterium]|nr:glycoside hydrolase family 3 C-terminal domain-containing protein [Eubacteriales bacterium]